MGRMEQHHRPGSNPARSRERAMTSLFRNRWWVVFATICGLLVGAGPINVFTFGVFLKPITEDLGLSRGAFSAALTFHAAIAAIVLPLIGWLVDRWGARRIMGQQSVQWLALRGRLARPTAPQ